MSRRRPVPPLALLLAALFAAVIGLGGCGQKGDLYLPDRAEQK
ncbi:MAG: LPS translocon maturation chaperone LptM [Gammaproteobacteria bacterium]